MKIMTVNDVVAQKKNHDFYLQREVFSRYDGKTESLSGSDEVLVLFSISSP